MTTQRWIIAGLIFYALCGIVSYGHEVQRDPCPVIMNGSCSRVGVGMVGTVAAVFWPLHLSSVLWSKQ